MPLTMEEAYDAAYTFAFDPPFVEAIVSNTPDARGADLQIRGLNFGWQQNDVLVTIGGMECMNAQWQNDGLIRCSKLEDVVGPKNLTVLAANRTEPFVFEAWEELVISECQRGVYEGIRGELCLNCEEEHPGANCTDSHI